MQNQQRIENVTIGLAHSAAIGGRVYGINGIPLAEMTVEALQVGYRDVRRKLIAVGKRATTDDRGEYRIYWLSPGEYYIRASFASRPSPRAAQGVVYGATYYPGVVDPVSAAPVVLRSGTEITNVDFMANANSGFRVSGPVVSSATKIGPRQSVGLVYVTPHDVNSVEDLTAFINSSAKPDVFEISGLKPGSYDLFPFLLTPLGRVLVDRIPVVVVNQDVTVAAASLGPGIEVKGTIVSQATNGVRPPSLRIGLTSLDNLPNLLTPYSAEVDSEGAFELTGVHDARYGFMVLGLPRDWFVVDVRHPGESVYDDGLIVGGTPPVPVEVIISPGGGKVEGTVLDSQGKIRANAIVTLVPAPTHRKNPFLYKRDVSDQSGHFTIEGIAPGEYKVFAWNSMSQPAYQNAEFISAYEQRGILLQVTKDAKLDAGVRLISNQNDQN